jgi:hypothetical protein
MTTSDLNSRTKDRVLFATLIMIIAIVWGWALPRLARTPTIRDGIEQSRRYGINPAAIYYTDVFTPRTGPLPEDISL